MRFVGWRGLRGGLTAMLGMVPSSQHPQPLLPGSNSSGSGATGLHLRCHGVLAADGALVASPEPSGCCLCVSLCVGCGTIGLPPHYDRRRHAGVCVISTVHHAGVSQHLRVRACARWLRAVWLFPHAQRPQCACLFSRVSPMHGWLRVPGSYYRATARELKRLEAISFSPIQNKFGETVDGLASIRAFGLQVRWRCAWYNGALVWPPTSFVSAVE